MDAKDYLLLEYLSQFTQPIKIRQKDMPHEVAVNFQFYGSQHADSIHKRLFELSKYKLVRQKGAEAWEITEPGKTELKKYRDTQPKPTFEQQCDRVLDLIVKESERNVMLSQATIAQQLEINPSLLQAITSEFIERGFVKRLKPDILDVQNSAVAFYHKTSFVKEKEEKEKSGFFQSVTNNINGDGNVVTTGKENEVKPQSPFDKSFNFDLPAENPMNQVSNEHKKITIATILKSLWDMVSKNPLIATIIATIIAYLILKWCKIL